ncbi:MAG: OB-fold domain-containing protein [Alphaproteobacteria bacterium]|jgi:hypothetical protein|nr:OB-fold domain-containing protein [Alphaproteobacteria bacterium]MDP6567695.1 OB-fold domain-containing protein [Alphaproteobacteria bacterium]MDP6814417.1 OB-fold domain-containing protein [Alphaproteobacteria bacterium]
MTAGGEVFWDGCAVGEFRLLRCDGCGQVDHMGPSRCRRCHGAELTWIAAEGGGTVASFTIVRRAPSAGLREWVPYGLALIDLDEGTRVMARLAGEPEDWRIGGRVRLCFIAAGEAPGDFAGDRLPAFAPETGEAACGS